MLQTVNFYSMKFILTFKNILFYLGYSNSCLNLKILFGIINDGEYNLNITNKIVSVRIKTRKINCYIVNV